MLGCATMQSRWENSESSNTIEAYEAFLKKYPVGEFSKLAKDRLDKLYYYRARGENTIEAYLNYIKNFPQSIYRDSSMFYAENLAWEEVKKNNSVEGYLYFSNIFPDGEYADSALFYGETLAWKEALDMKSVESYENFIHKFPKGLYADSALFYRNKILWLDEQKQTEYASHSYGTCSDVIKAVENLERVLDYTREDHKWYYASYYLNKLYCFNKRAKYALPIVERVLTESLSIVKKGTKSPDVVNSMVASAKILNQYSSLEITPQVFIEIINSNVNNRLIVDNILDILEIYGPNAVAAIPFIKRNLSIDRGIDREIKSCEVIAAIGSAASDCRELLEKRLMEKKKGYISAHLHYALARIGSNTEEHIETLIKSMQEGEDRAVYYLGMLGEEATMAIPIMIKLLKTDLRVSNIYGPCPSISVINALGKIGGEKAVNAICELINDGNGYTKLQAILALARLNAAPELWNAVLPLTKALKDDYIDELASLKSEMRTPPYELSVQRAAVLALRNHHMEKYAFDFLSRDHKTICRYYEIAILLGVPGTEDVLIEAFQMCGRKKMANAFLNSGNEKLAEAASSWAKRRGLKIVDVTSGRLGVTWGSSTNLKQD